MYNYGTDLVASFHAIVSSATPHTRSMRNTILNIYTVILLHSFIHAPHRYCGHTCVIVQLQKPKDDNYRHIEY